MILCEESGFSLIETLVALSILAVSASIILSVSEAHIQSVSAIHERTWARWIAQNRVLEIDAQQDDLPSVVTFADRAWRVSRTTLPTSDPGLVRVDVFVNLDRAASGSLVQLTRYVQADGEQP